MKIAERVAALRKKMEEFGIDHYVIPTDDFHHSEYVGEHFKARAFITGFTGSAGVAVVTRDEAFLWTDGRYFIQAAEQLEGSPVKLMKMREPGVPTIPEFLRATLPEGGTLGFDGRVIAMSDGKEYEEIVKEKHGKIVYEQDLIDAIWEDRPELSKKEAFALDLKYAGESTADKLVRIREKMAEKGATSHILTTLDDICWVMNMRGDDVAFSPLVLAYMNIGMEKADLYMDESKLDEAMKASFAKDGIVLHPYNDIYEDVKGMDASEVVWIDPTCLNYALYNNIPASVKKIEADSPEILFKALKNPVEVENIRKAEIKDSVAHVRFMKWLKENYKTIVITEMSASEKLDEFRVEMGNFIRPSFDAISSYGAHSAMCHYSSTPETNVELKEGQLFLTDTGAGYWEGSTDITRTYALGEVPQIMKDHFTLVAVSNLHLASAKFLKGCSGVNLDILARKPFWDRGLNYNHGTGHGVGYLLNIHEGPASFRWQRRPDEDATLQEGMLLTDEPGIYIEGSHGVRLENELLVREGEANEYGQFMYLETLTFVPMDLDAINADMMTEEEKKLLNNYHAEVFEKVSPFLNEEETEWLRHYTRAI